jgi:hypothetical protein
MTESDMNLVRQMMEAGRYRAVYDLMPDYNLLKSKKIIEKMGNMWCCHPDNQVKRLDVPLEILKINQSKVLKKRG